MVQQQSQQEDVDEMCTTSEGDVEQQQWQPCMGDVAEQWDNHNSNIVRTVEEQMRKVEQPYWQPWRNSEGDMAESWVGSCGQQVEQQ